MNHDKFGITGLRHAIQIVPLLGKWIIGKNTCYQLVFVRFRKAFLLTSGNGTK